MKRLIKVVAASAVVLIVLLIGYGTLIEPRLILDEERIRAPLPGLPAQVEQPELAVIADLHVGMWFANIAMAERIIDRVVEEDPDALLIAGDFVYSEDPANPEKIEQVLDILAPVLDAGIPVYAVLGNHDYLVRAEEQLTDALRLRGVTVLHNDSALLRLGGSAADIDLHIVGIGPAHDDLADVDEALRGVPDEAPRFVMMHNPTTFPAMPAGSAPLAVAGHTHCGQIALPGTPQWSYLDLSTSEAMATDGFAPDDFGAEGNRLFVTCGIGFSLLPMRIGAPPQLVFVDLEPAPA